MFGKAVLAALAAAAVLTLAPAPLPMHVAQAACEPGTKVDSTTADQTRKKLEGAGYRKVRDLKKGCDNTWHATAEKDGAATGVAVTAKGEIYPERDD